MDFSKHMDKFVVTGVVIVILLLGSALPIIAIATGTDIHQIEETETFVESIETIDEIAETTITETSAITESVETTIEETVNSTEAETIYTEPTYEEYIEYHETELIPEIEYVVEEYVDEYADEYVEYCPDGLSADMDAVLREACNERSVPYEVMLAIIYTESGFNPYAVNSSSGCFGYCQLHPLYYNSSMSPADNIRCGVNLLGDNLEKYGDIWAAITAYAVGHDNGSRSYANLIIQRARGYGYTG